MTAPDLPSLPDPLVSAEVDLRDFGWMPIDIARLFGSEFHARSSDTAWRAGVTLWLKAYHQVPAGSIPDDEVSMARLAELGRDLKTWRRIKAEVLRGWVRCSDGRFHHPVVAEKALEAWIEKLIQRKASAAGNAKRYGLTFDAAPFDAAVNDSLRRLAALNPNSRTLSKRVPKGGAKPDGGTPADIPPGDKPDPAGMPEQSQPEAGKLLPGSRDAPTGRPGTSHREAGEVPPGCRDAPSGIPRDPTLQDLIPPEPPSGSLPPAGVTPRRGTRLPNGWTLDLIDRGYAAEQGLAEVEVGVEAEKFRDYWLAENGPKAWKRDWRAAWRTWCRRAVDDRPRGPGLLMPIRGGARTSPANGIAAHRPTSGSASALVGIAAAVNAHREAS